MFHSFPPPSGGGETMSGHFDGFIESLLSGKGRQGYDEEFRSDIDDAEILYLYSKIVDKMVMDLFDENTGNWRITHGFRQLSTMQRMVILFNIIYGINLKTTATLIGSSLNSVKVQKNRALKRLKEEIADA